MTRRAVLAGILLAVVFLTGGSAGANSITDTATCRRSPDPQPPNAGLAGIMAQPDPDKIPPPEADPFAPGSPYTVYNVYGFGGLQWPVYDQGCVGNATATPMNLLANGTFTAPIFETALSQQVSLQMRHPSWLGIFDPLIGNAIMGIRDGFFRSLLPLTLFVVAIWVVWVVRSGNLQAGLRGVGWMAVVFILAMLFLSRPLSLVHWLDDALGTTTGAIDESFGDNDAQIGQVHRQILYTTWLTGMFGDADTATARKYGPDLFKAGAYSWREVEYMQAHPDEAQHIKEEKQQRWADIADAIAHEDPIAYEHLQGAHGDNRFWHALFALLGVLGATLFTLIAGFAVVFAFFAIRMFVLAWPVTAILAMVPTQRLFVLRLWSYLTGSVISAVGMLFIARLVTLFVGVILGTAGLAGWLVVFLILVVCFAAWRLSRSMRSFAGGHVGKAVRYATKAAVVFEGLKFATEEGTERGIRQATQPNPTAAPSGSRATPTYTATATTRDSQHGWEAPPRQPVPANAVRSGEPVPDYTSAGLNAGPKPEPQQPQHGDVIDMEPRRDRRTGRDVYRPVARPRSKRPTVDR